MGNCLKTQLKESVNNDNLVGYGAIRISFTHQSSPSVYSNLFGITNPDNSTENMTIKVISGNIRFVNTDQDLPDWTSDDRSITEATIAPGTGYSAVCLNYDGVIEISGKYVWSTLSLTSGFTINANDLYCPNVGTSLYFYQPKLQGNLQTMNSLPSYIKSIRFIFDSTASYNGKFTDVLKNKDFYSLDISVCQESYVLSEILANNTSLHDITLNYNGYASGSLQCFLDDTGNALRFPSLVSIRCNSTKRLEKPQAAVDKLRQLGVTIVY